MIFFFFNDTATTEIYTLSLHDALPISSGRLVDCPSASRDGAAPSARPGSFAVRPADARAASGHRDRKSTRLNSSHLVISYAVFCLKKKIDENVLTVFFHQLGHYVRLES